VATVAYSWGGVCAGGGHVTLNVSLNGGQARQVVYTTDDVRAPLGALTQEERETLALLILKLHFAGMTRAAMRAELEAGVTVTV
jgi:hypothetical protein